MTAERRKEVREITQRVGAHVICDDGGFGVVTGHYNDDIVYVQFNVGTHPERVWVSALHLDNGAGQPEPKPDECEHPRVPFEDLWAEYVNCPDCGALVG